MLSIKNLCYKDILKNISFELPKGSMSIIVGKNGSGKSCLLRCIKGLYKYSGQIVGNEDCALVFQDTDMQILGQTVQKDIEFSLKGTKEEKEQRVKNIAKDFDLLPLLSRRPESLSGGEKRRVAIADVAVTDATLILLDEPFANLDYPGVKSVLTLLQKLHKQGKTIIIVSHEVEKVLALCDYTVVINEGKILNFGPTEEVFNTTDFEKVGVKVCSKLEDMTWL